MEIGMNLSAYRNLSVDKQIALLVKNGFTRFFYSSHLADLDESITKGYAAGLVCESLHAPFDTINQIWHPTLDGERTLEKLLDGVDKCEKYQIPVLVVHLSSGLTPPLISEVGFTRFARLMEYAKKKGVTIAYENQRMLGNIGYAFDMFPDARFCFDAGHESCFTPGRRYMPLFGDKVVELHLHDNDGVFDHDQHCLPFDGKVDFDLVARSLAAVHYEKAVMLEVFNHDPMYEGVTPEAFYERAASSARKIAQMVDSYR